MLSISSISSRSWSDRRVYCLQAIASLNSDDLVAFVHPAQRIMSLRIIGAQVVFLDLRSAICVYMSFPCAWVCVLYAYRWAQGDPPHASERPNWSGLLFFRDAIRAKFYVWFCVMLIDSVLHILHTSNGSNASDPSPSAGTRWPSNTFQYCSTRSSVILLRVLPFLRVHRFFYPFCYVLQKNMRFENSSN